jgi:hypothetical protein
MQKIGEVKMETSSSGSAGAKLHTFRHSFGHTYRFGGLRDGAKSETPSSNNI